jgi:hypothetical protein
VFTTMTVAQAGIVESGCSRPSAVAIHDDPDMVRQRVSKHERTLESCRIQPMGDRAQVHAAALP